MESLRYVMFYLCRGSLPWQGLKAATKKQKYDRIMEKNRPDKMVRIMARAEKLGSVLGFGRATNQSAYSLCRGQESEDLEGRRSGRNRFIMLLLTSLLLLHSSPPTVSFSGPSSAVAFVR
jgi:hypothetical protein